jgi:predicted nuclease of predicted toxin-antitoxin system
VKVLLDQGLPRSAVQFLNERGINAEHVGDLGMAKATDAVILAAAVKLDAIVVTLDADFHALLASSRSTSPSVVRVRIEDLKGDELAEIVSQVLEAAGEELDVGAVVSVTVDRIRVRLLPIGV